MTVPMYAADPPRDLPGRASPSARTTAIALPPNSAARAIPTIAATFSVPARRSFSWLPPNNNGSIFVPRRIYSARRLSARKIYAQPACAR